MERVSDYDYELPEDLIAQTPLEDRTASRLLHLDRATGQVWHRNFREAGDLLRPGDLLVLNRTRVSAVRLHGRKASGGAVEALLLRQVDPVTYVALLGASRRPKIGTRLFFGEGLEATVGDRVDTGGSHLHFSPVTDFYRRLDAVASAPLPPYIKAELKNRERYQTVYGREEGSAAAPTAGLHFTEDFLTRLAGQGIELAFVTLHVGLDTFRPIREEDPDRHEMHGETCAVSKETAHAIASAAGRIIAVGTTTVRTLETFALAPRKVDYGEKCSKLFIRPGYVFRVVDGMFTNFHMPRTTMMMMISAMAGREAILHAYKLAVENRYRFLSFGDSMIIL